MANNILKLVAAIIFLSGFVLVATPMAQSQPFVQVTITNTKGMATQVPYQQVVSFNPSAYSPYLANDLGNIRFYAGAANTLSNQLSSVCVSGCSSSSSNSVFWVTLTSAIGADSNGVINMTLMPTNTEYSGIATMSSNPAGNSNALFNYPISYASASASNSAQSVSADAVTGTNNAALYICAGAINNNPTVYDGGTSIPTSYTPIVSTPSEEGAGQVAIIGTQSFDGCSTTVPASGTPAAVSSGISINGYNTIATTFIQYIYAKPNSLIDGPNQYMNLNFNVTGNNGFAVIAVACGFIGCDNTPQAQAAQADSYSAGAITVPSGCTISTSIDSDGFENTTIYTCNSLAPGTYTASYADDQGANNLGSHLVMAAYVFQNSTSESSAMLPVAFGNLVIPQLVIPQTPQPAPQTIDNPTWFDEGHSGNWTGVASSSNGNSVVAVQYNGLIWNSSTSGLNWAPTPSPVANWTSVASSSDGTHVVASAAYNAVWVTPNSGLTWTMTPLTGGDFTGVSSSSDGSHLTALQLYSSIYTSGTDARSYGIAWAQQYPSCATSNWQDSAELPSGLSIIAVSNNGGICTYSATYDTWTQTSTASGNFSAVAACGFADFFAVQNGGGIWMGSADNYPYTGQTWTATNAPTGDWKAVACSSDGSHIAAVQYNGGIWVSTDSGSTWNPTTAPTAEWTGITTSSSGNSLVAVQQNGDIYVGLYNYSAPVPATTPTTTIIGTSTSGGDFTGGSVGAGPAVQSRPTVTVTSTSNSTVATTTISTAGNASGDFTGGSVAGIQNSTSNATTLIATTIAAPTTIPATTSLLPLPPSSSSGINSGSTPTPSATVPASESNSLVAGILVIVVAAVICIYAFGQMGKSQRKQQKSGRSGKRSARK